MKLLKINILSYNDGFIKIAVKFTQVLSIRHFECKFGANFWNIFQWMLIQSCYGQAVSRTRRKVKFVIFKVREKISNIMENPIWEITATLADECEKLRSSLQSTLLIYLNAFLAISAIIFNSVTIQALRKSSSLPKPLKTLRLSRK